MHQFIMYQARMLGKYRESSCSVDTILLRLSKTKARAPQATRYCLSGLDGKRQAPSSIVISFSQRVRLRLHLRR